MKNTLILLDGSSLLYRSFFGVRPLHTATGVPTHAIYGFCRTLKNLTEQLKPTHMVLVWDSKGPTARHHEYADYKATRQAPPSDLLSQKIAIQTFADTIGLRQVSKQGVEADDLIYSIAHEHLADLTIVVTGDKDLLQLLSPTTQVFDPFKNKIITVESFTSERGFAPEDLLLYHSLLGDSSDNIPGVRGVGEKTAEKLVSTYHTLENLYANLPQLSSSRIGQLLTQHEADARISHALFTLRYAQSGLSLSDTLYSAEKWLDARSFFATYQITPFFPAGVTPTATAAPITHAAPAAWQAHLVTTATDLAVLVSKLRNAAIIAFDTETTSLDPFRDEVVGISCAIDQDNAYYIPFGHVTKETQLSQETVFNTLRPLLEDATKPKVFHHAKFDQRGFARYGITVQGITFDTLIAAYLLRTGSESISLKNLSLRYFGEEMASYEQTTKKLPHFGHVPLAQAATYAAHDARQTLKLYHALKPQLTQLPQLYKLFEEVELPTSNLLHQMETNGIILDDHRLRSAQETVTSSIRDLTEKIRTCLEAGAHPVDLNTINLNSPTQVEALLFDTLRLPSVKKSSKTGSRSTDSEVLKELSKIHPIPGLIMQYREMSKLLGTYLEPLPHEINPRTGKIHTTFSQTITATGRLSSSNPNLQNIPVGEPFGHQIRAAFVPAPGTLFLSADYSQIELRVLAHMSGDANLIDAFLHNRDIHTQTTAQLFSCTAEQVTHNQRQIGKKINFSIMYGLTPFGLAQDLGISPSQAKRYIDEYFSNYPGVRSWMEKTIATAKERGYVETILGHRRYVPGLNERNKHVQDAERRIAINTPIQGSTADLMKLAMLAVEAKLRTAKLQTQQILQIHDELLLQVPLNELEAVQRLVQDTMQSIVSWQIPLNVSLRTGASWGEASK